MSFILCTCASLLQSCLFLFCCGVIDDKTSVIKVNGYCSDNCCLTSLKNSASFIFMPEDKAVTRGFLEGLYDVQGQKESLSNTKYICLILQFLMSNDWTKTWSSYLSC